MPSLLAAGLLSLSQLWDLEHGTTPLRASWQYLQTPTDLLAPCPCCPLTLHSVVTLVVKGLETFTSR